MFGLLDAHGEPHAGWGDWKHIMDYAKQVMSSVITLLLKIPSADILIIQFLKPEIRNKTSR